MKQVLGTGLPELVTVKGEAAFAFEPGQVAAPLSGLTAVKQEVDIEEHDLLQLKISKVDNYHVTTDSEGILLTPIENNVSTRTRGDADTHQIISESNIKTELNPISEEECRIKTEERSLLNENSLIVNEVSQDCARELRRSGRFCAECRVLFPSCSALAAHLNLKHSYAPAGVTDSSGDNTTPRALNASDGIQKYNESAKSSSAANCSFRCEHCDYSCAAAETLRRHNRLHDPKRRHECNVCHYRFRKLSTFNMHLRKHTDVKPFKCDLCNYRCSQKPALTSHIRLHSNEKPFKCNLCEYKCSRRNYLESHKMSKHTKEKPFKCDLCEYKCSRRKLLNHHKISKHTEEKPFKCDLCDYTCPVRSNLISHLAVHTEKAFKCNLCKYKTSRKQDLKRHEKTHKRQAIGMLNSDK